ncbi:MAG: hypothetical protein AAGN66_18740 [Acidobacteriota bacterium]
MSYGQPDNDIATDINVHNDIEDDVVYEVDGGRPGLQKEFEMVGGEKVRVTVDPETNPFVEHTFKIKNKDGKVVQTIIRKVHFSKDVRLGYDLFSS